MRKFTRNNRGRFTKKKTAAPRTRNNRGRFAKAANTTKKNRPRNKLGRWLGF